MLHDFMQHGTITYLVVIAVCLIGISILDSSYWKEKRKIPLLPCLLLCAFASSAFLNIGRSLCMNAEVNPSLIQSITQLVKGGYYFWATIVCFLCAIVLARINKYLFFPMTPLCVAITGITMANFMNFECCM